MTNNLEKLEAMTDIEFTQFLGSLPARVQLTVRSGLVDWRDVLPQWLDRAVAQEQPIDTIDINNYPF